MLELDEWWWWWLAEDPPGTMAVSSSADVPFRLPPKLEAHTRQTSTMAPTLLMDKSILAAFATGLEEEVAMFSELLLVSIPPR